MFDVEFWVLMQKWEFEIDVAWLWACKANINTTVIEFLIENDQVQKIDEVL